MSVALDRHTFRSDLGSGSAAAAPRMSMRDEHRNGISTRDLTVLLNAVLDVIGVPVTERCYAKSLAAMESALLEGR